MRKAFSFKTPSEGTTPEPLILEINGEDFTLTSDIEGIEMLRLTGEATSFRGIHVYLSRVIADSDWDRFTKTVKDCKVSDFVGIANTVADLYAGNPTMEAGAS